MTSGAVEAASAAVGVDSALLVTAALPLPPPLLQPEVALTAGEEDLDEIVALCDDLQGRRRESLISLSLILRYNAVGVK